MIIKSDYPHLDPWFIDEIYDELQEDNYSIDEISLFLEEKNFDKMCEESSVAFLGEDSEVGIIGSYHVYDEIIQEWVDRDRQIRIFDKRWDILRKENLQRMA